MTNSLRTAEKSEDKSREELVSLTSSDKASPAVGASRQPPGADESMVRGVQPSLTPPSDNKRLDSMRKIILRWIGEGEKETAPSPNIQSKKKKVVPEKVVAVAPPVEPALLASPRVLLLSSEPSVHSILRRLYMGLWTILAALVVVLAISVYGFKINNQTVNALLSYVPLPYAMVRFHPIWYHTARRDAAILKKFNAEQRPNQQFVLTPSEIEKILVRRALTNDLAWSHGLWVTEREVKSTLAEVVREAGSPNIVASQIRSLWGMSAGEYSERVLMPYILKQKLFTLLRQDPVIGAKLVGANGVHNLDVYIDSLRPLTAVWSMGPEY